MRWLAYVGIVLLLSAVAWGQTPVISGVTVSDVTSTGFTVSWTTDIASDTFVGWGYDDGYGHDSGATDATGVTSHSQTITGIMPGNGVSYVLRSRALTGGVPDPSKATYYQSSSSVSIPAGSSSGTFDYAIEVIGPHRVIQGYDVYIYVRTAAIAGSSSFKDNSSKTIITGLPPYSAIHWADQEYDGLGQGSRSTTNVTNDTLTQWGIDGSRQFQIITNVGGTTPTGEYTIHVTTQTTKTDNSAGPAKDVSWTLTVASPTTLTKTAISSYPAIPELSTWAAHMTTYGPKWCLQTGAGGNEQAVWYYDGTKVFYQIADYTHDAATWIPCVESVLADYRDGYVIPQNGGIPRFRVFPHGMYMDYLRTGNSASRSGVTLLANNSGMRSTSLPLVRSTMMREATYGLGALRMDNALGTDHTVLLQQSVSTVLGHIEQVIGGNAEWVQPFMTGLMAQALIECYEDSSCPGYQDARVPPAIKSLADWLWTNAWISDGNPSICGGSSFYSGKPDYGCFYYNSYQRSIGLDLQGTMRGSDVRNVNLLIVPMFGWLWKMTGDSTYQTQGDTIWTAGVLSDPAAGVNWSGKNFSQQYRWSFDYVKWRSQPAASRKRTLGGSRVLGGSHSVQ